MCASLILNKEKREGVDWGGGRSASPPKQIGNTYFHMQGAGYCWVECDTQGVYTTRHAPWKHGVQVKAQRCTIVSFDVIIELV